MPTNATDGIAIKHLLLHLMLAIHVCRWGEGLLAPDVARARESLEHWRSQTASEARLARALNEGSSTQVGGNDTN